jgi:signal transduction histidine kinase
VAALLARLVPGRPTRRKRSARRRLTVMYGALFLLLGTGLLALVYVLTTVSSESVAIAVRPTPSGATVTPLGVPGVPNAPPAPAFVSPVRYEIAAQRDHDAAHLLAVSWIVLALATLGAALLGWLAAGRVLAPLRSITDTARTISAGNLHERLALDGPEDEFKRLGDTLDALLGRLEASFEAQRRFVANASHELRTPLTLERTLLQVALADPHATADDLRGACRELLVSQTEHERLLEALLTLATSERGLDQQEPLDLRAVAAAAVAAAEQAALERGLFIEPELAAAPISGDHALVGRLVANLLDNAIAHNVPGGTISVQTGREQAASLLTVANPGLAIEPERIDGLFEPFQRGGDERTGDGGHYGLGLSIVRAIAGAHGATASASPGPVGGLAVTVRFPDAAN